MKNIDTAFSVQALWKILNERLYLSPQASLIVAYSGGVDSHVLLHALCQLRARTSWLIQAVHVDHGLQPISHEWAKHCRDVCENLHVPCHVDRVIVQPRRGEGQEAAARRVRYACLANHMAPGAVLLTAHHQDDQAETLLLQLLRGAGLHGLAAMPRAVAFAGGLQLRPLLDFRRRDLAAYAVQHDLRWIEDTSNRDLNLARNFIRHAVLPLVESRWPAAAPKMACLAGHAAETAALLNELAEKDLQQCQAGKALNLDALLALSDQRVGNVLRYWIRAQGFQPPPAAILEQILRQMRRTPRSGLATIHWPGAEVRRYRNRLSLHVLEPDPDPTLQLTWKPPEPLTIPELGLRLYAVSSMGHGLSRARVTGKTLDVRFRRGGESCRLPGRTHHHKLKKLLQEAGVPPWERRRLPLIYIDGQLAAVADRWVCEPYCARGDEPAWRVVLENAYK